MLATAAPLHYDTLKFANSHLQIATYPTKLLGPLLAQKSLIAFRRVASQAMEYTLLLFEMSIGIAINMFAEICKLIVRL